MKSSFVMKDYFESEVQEAFWKGMTPDLTNILDEVEKRETWTYTIDEFRELFISLATALPDIVQLPLKKEHQTIVHKLIPVLLAMPTRQCLSTVAYLDRYGATEKNPVGWGVVCYLEASEQMHNDDIPHEQQVLFKTFCERVQMFVSSTISVELFLHLNKEVIESVK